jgi:hypothetical protein
MLKNPFLFLLSLLFAIPVFSKQNSFQKDFRNDKGSYQPHEGGKI